MAYFIIRHTDKEGKESFFCRFNGFYTPSWSEDENEAKYFPSLKNAQEAEVKLTENLPVGEDLLIIEKTKLDTENDCLAITPEEVSEATGWRLTDNYEKGGRSLWTRYNAETGYLEAAIRGEIPTDVFEASGNNHIITCVYMNWKKRMLTKGMHDYEEKRRISALPDMRSGT